MRSTRKIPRAVPWTSEEWVAYYRRNARGLLRLPWERGAELSDAHKDVLSASLQDFQLGESSEGLQLLARAEAHARAAADPAYVDAIRCFIGEEQRHAATLARFLAAAGVPPREHTRLDSAFRWFRHRVGFEWFLRILVAAEMIGKVYYRAVLRASDSALLRGICTQLLRDEVRHLRFHFERLAQLRRHQPAWKQRMTNRLYWCFYRGTALAVWLRHHRAFRAGGVHFQSYWAQCRTEWRAMEWRTDADNYLFPTIRCRPPVSVCNAATSAETEACAIS